MLVLHDEGGERVEHVPRKLGLAHPKDLSPVDVTRRQKLFVLQSEKALAADALVGSLDRPEAVAEDREADLVADEVRVGPQIDQVGVDVAITELADKAFFDDLLVGGLVIGDVQCGFQRQLSCPASEGHLRL